MDTAPPSSASSVPTSLRKVSKSRSPTIHILRYPALCGLAWSAISPSCLVVSHNAVRLLYPFPTTRKQHGLALLDKHMQHQKALRKARGMPCMRILVRNGQPLCQIAPTRPTSRQSHRPFLQIQAERTFCLVTKRIRLYEGRYGLGSGCVFEGVTFHKYIG